MAHTSTLKTGEITPVNREIHWSSAIYRDRLWWKVDQVQSARTRTSWIGAPRWGGCRKIPKSFNKKTCHKLMFFIEFTSPKQIINPPKCLGYIMNFIYIDAWHPNVFFPPNMAYGCLWFVRWPCHESRAPKAEYRGERLSNFDAIKMYQRDVYVVCFLGIKLVCYPIYRFCFFCLSFFRVGWCLQNKFSKSAKDNHSTR